MEKLLAAGAAAATLFVLPAAPAFAADAPAIKPVCLLLPLLPDCLKAWTKMGEDRMMAPAKMADRAPAPAMHIPMWSCSAAAAGADHLLDCAKI